MSKNLQELYESIDVLIQRHYDYLNWYESKIGIQKNYYSCDRCFGNGTISQFKHIQGGRCFACNGSGKLYK